MQQKLILTLQQQLTTMRKDLSSTKVLMHYHTLLRFFIQGQLIIQHLLQRFLIKAGSRDFMFYLPLMSRPHILFQHSLNLTLELEVKALEMS